MRMYRVLLHKETKLGMRSVRSNLMVAVLAYSEITVDKIKSSFEKRGLWPMNYSFLRKCKEKGPSRCTNSPNCSEKE